jgi:hypothetical protein
MKELPAQCDMRIRQARRPVPSQSGFTRVEMSVILATLALLALIVLPALANNRERTQRVLCVNNLRLAGQAFHQWGTEHSGRLPWRTPWWEGGSTWPAGTVVPSGQVPPGWLISGIYNNLWFQWYWLSNELHTPRILACPSDAQARVATKWDSDPGAGFLHANFRNRAVSYLLGLDVFPQDRDGLIAGDRNVRFDITATSCSSGIAPVQGLSFNPGNFGIGSGLHVEAGNYLFIDGRVEELSSQGFVRRLKAIYGGQDNGSAHYLTP